MAELERFSFRKFRLFCHRRRGPPPARQPPALIVLLREAVMGTSPDEERLLLGYFSMVGKSVCRASDAQACGSACVKVAEVRAAENAMLRSACVRVSVCFTARVRARVFR